MTDPIEYARRLLDMNRPAEAVRAASAAVRERPNDPDALRVLAAALYEADDYAAALAAARSACELAPDDHVAHRLRAMCLLERDEVEAARQAVGESLRIAPWDAWTFNIVARVELAAGDGDKARAAAEQALALEPSASSSHFTAGLVALGTGRDKDAVAAFERVLAIDPHDTYAMHNIAIARGDNIESTKLLAHVVGMNPRLSLSARELDTRLRGLVVAYVVGTTYLLFATYALTAGFGVAAPGSLMLRALVPAVTTVLFVRYLRRLPQGARRLLGSRMRLLVPSRRSGVPLAGGAVALTASLAIPAARRAVWPVAVVVVLFTFWAAVLLTDDGDDAGPVALPVDAPVSPKAFAPMRSRIGAALFDALATFVAGLVAGSATALVASSVAGGSRAWGVTGLVAGFAAVAVALPILSVKRYGATLGQREAGIAVVDIWTGMPPAPGRMLRRMGWWWVSWATFGAGWFPAWHGRPSLADRRTTSAVVRRARRPY